MILTQVVRYEHALPTVILKAHSPAATSAECETLKQRWALAGRRFQFDDTRLGIPLEILLVLLKLFPTDVAGMGSGDQGVPLFAGHHTLDATASRRVLGMPSATIKVSTGVARVLQYRDYVKTTDR